MTHDIRNAAKSWLATYYDSTRKKGRQFTVGASDIGKCARRTAHEKIGTPHSVHVDVNGYAFRGTMYEEHFLVPMTEKWAEFHGAKLIYAGKDQKRLIQGFLSGTPDGLVVNAPYDMLEPYGVVTIESDCFAVEFKSIDPRISDDALPKPEHRLQVNTQLGLFRELTEHTPNYGLLIYTNASDPSDIRPFVIEFDEEIYKGSKMRAGQIMTCVHQKTPLSLRPEGKIDGGKECAECPWDHSSTCGGYGFAIPERVKPIPEYVEKTLNAYAERREKLKDQIKEATGERSRLEAHIKELMASAGTSRVRAADFDIFWSKQAGRKSFDKEAALNKLVCDYGHDKDEFYKEGDGFDKLTVKRKPKRIIIDDPLEQEYV